MKYYYFYNDTKIKVRDIAVNVALFPQFVEMTEAQREFYIANPTASVVEVKRCELCPRPQEPTLEEVKVSAIKELSDLSLEVSERIVPSYKVQNAQITLLGNSDFTIYTLDDAQDIVAEANEVGTRCRALFYSSKSRVETCLSIEEVQSIVEETKVEYNTIESEYEKTL